MGAAPTHAPRAVAYASRRLAASLHIASCHDGGFDTDRRRGSGTTTCTRARPGDASASGAAIPLPAKKVRRSAAHLGLGCRRGRAGGGPRLARSPARLPFCAGAEDSVGQGLARAIPRSRREYPHPRWRTTRLHRRRPVGTRLSWRGRGEDGSGGGLLTPSRQRGTGEEGSGGALLTPSGRPIQLEGRPRSMNQTVPEPYLTPQRGSGGGSTVEEKGAAAATALASGGGGRLGAGLSNPRKFRAKKWNSPLSLTIC
ncbi:hypothetical protein DAI22_03g292450 [Oryza sativa Japonica Group]|nr:hypothetical protein DAI22_03g292450 [Oryza sativa Japonica Group]